MSIEKFSAGGDWDSTEAVAESVTNEAASQEAAPADAGSELQDNLAGGEEPAPQAEEKTEPAAPTFLEVKGAGKVAKFDLKADDPNLKKTLEFGLQAPIWKQQRDEARNALKSKDTEIGSLREKASVWEEIRELAQAGQYDQIVRAVLGEKYDDYERQRVHLENATQEERWAHERKMLESQRTLERARLERQLQAEKDRFHSSNEAALERRLESQANAAFAKHSFSEFGFNNDIQSDLKQDLWDGAWGMVQNYLESKGLKPSDITQEMLDKAFERKYAKMVSTYKAVGDSKATAVVEQKKQEAKQAVKAAVTERYPSGADTDLTKGWDGRSAKDLKRTLLRAFK